MTGPNPKTKTTALFSRCLGALLLAGALLAFGLSTTFLAPVHAAPDQLPFSARMTTPSGNNVPDGLYNVTFNLYTGATGGSPIWTESHSVTVTKGEFAVYLGDTTPLTGINFTGTLFLSFQVESDPEMTPRYELGSVPGALNSAKLNNLDSTAFFQKALNETVTGNTTFSGTATFSNSSTFTGGVAIQPASLSGNSLLVNTAAGFNGNLIALQVNGSNKLTVNQLGNTNVAGTFTSAGALTVSGGGANITGNSTITGTLGGITGLTVVSGGASITGNSTIAGTLGGITGLTVTSGGAAITGNSTVTGNLQVTGGLTAVGTTLTGQLTSSFSPSSASAGWAIAAQGAPLNTPNSSLVAIGDGGFSGAANGFVGSNSGTLLGLNSNSSFSGNLVDFQVAGVSQFKATAAGHVTTAGGITVTSGGITVSAGGFNVTGNSTLTGTLGGLTGLTVASGGANISGGLTVATGNFAVSSGTITSSGNINTTGGTVQTNSTTRIDNSGNLTNIGNINASGTITGATLTDGTLAVNSGAVTGGTTGVFGTSLTTPTLYGGTLANGNLTLQSTSNITKGNVYFNGTTAYVDGASNLFGASLNVGAGTVTSGLVNGQTISSSASFTNTVTTGGKLTVSSGGADVTGNITLGGNLLPSGSRDIGASGNRFTNGYFGSVDVNTLTVNTSQNVNGAVTITSATSPQLTVKYDGSNYYTTSVSSAGAVTFDATGSSASFTFADGVTANVFNSSGVTITGGNIDATAIGLTTRSTGKFTSLDANNGLTVAGTLTLPNGSVTNAFLQNSSITVNNGTNITGAGSAVALGGSVTISVVNNPTFSGLVTAQNGVTISTGNLSISAGTATASGNINSTGGGIQTNSVTRIDNSGNLTNIGNINASGTITGATLTDGTLSVTSGALTGGTTAVFGTSVTTPTLYGGALSNGNLTLQSTSNVTKGNVYFNGTTAYVDGASNLFGASLNVGAGTVTSGLVNGQTISSSASFTNTVTTGGKLTVSGGGADVTGNITLGGNLLPSGSRDVGASGNRFTNGYFGSVDVNTLTVNSSQNVNGTVTITSATSPQLTVKYDGSNYYTTSVSSAGAVTFDATGAGAAFTFADGLTANVFNSSGVTLTGGTIDGIAIGSTTRSTGKFTSLDANNGLTVSSGGASITGNSSVTGTLGVSQLLTAQNGFTLSGGTLTLPNSSVTNAFLQNPSLTVTAGTNLTGGGLVALGSSTTLHVIDNPTFAGLVTASAGLSVTGGINNNNGGITNTGAITQATNITGTGTITGGTLTDGTLSINGGAVTGGTTAIFGTSVTTPTLYGGTTSGGNLTLQSTSNVTKGNVYFNGTTAYVDGASNLFGASLNVGSGTITSGLINGQTISSSASFSNTVAIANGLTVSAGGAGITGNITLGGNLLPSGSRDVGASGNRFTNGYFGTVDVNTLTVNTSENINGGVVITSAATPQLTVKYDGSNYYTTAVASNGAVTFDATGAGAAFTFADGLTANVFASSGVTITGGTIDATAIGSTTRSTGKFTSLDANNGITVTSGGATITGNSTVIGTLGVTQLLTAQNGLTVSGGNLAVSSGTITASGNINTTGGALQTNSVTRVDNSGNLTNIGTIGASGTATLSATNQNALAVTGSPQAAATVSLVQLGSAISGGSSGTNGGTFVGVNAASAFAGDFFDLQVNNVKQFVVTAGGAVTQAGALTVSSGGANVSGGVTVATGDVNITGGVLQTAGTTRLTNAGVLQNVTYQGNTIAVDYGGTGIASYTAGDLVYAVNGTTLGKIGISGTDTLCLISNGTVPFWGSCTGTGSGVNLQSTYGNGNTINTTDGRDVAITLTNTTTDANFTVNIATGSTGKFAVQGNSLDIFAVTSSGTTISSGGIAVTGNSTITGTLGVTQLLTAQNGLTVSGGNLAVSSGTITASGNINSTGGGIQTNSVTRIDNSGNLTNIGNINASGTITGGTLTDGTLSIASGAITGGVTGVFSTSLTTPTLYGGTTSGGNLTLQSTSNVTKGNVYFNGTTAYVDASSNLFGAALNVGSGTITSGLVNGQTISSSASFTNTVTTGGKLTVSGGGADITGNITLAGNLLPSGSRDIGASGNRFTNGYFGTVDVNTLTVNTSENINGGLVITSATSPQLTVKYDNSNYYTTAVSSAGAVTFDATGTGASFTFADGVTANIFNSSGVTITGGTIDGTTIGGTTRAAGSFTTLAANNGLTVSAGGASITGNSTITGTLGVTQLLTAQNGLTVSGGNLAVSSGTVTASGNINSTGGAIQTNSTTRIDNSGNLSNIGTIAASGTETLSATGQNALAVTGAPQGSATVSLIQLGSAISGGSSGTNGGTFVGINAASAFIGDFLNLQINNGQKFLITSGGAVTEAGALTVSAGGASITGGVTVASSDLNITAGVLQTAGTTRLTNAGVLQNVTYQGNTIAAAYGGTGVSSYAAGDILYASGSTTLSKLSVGSDGTCLVLVSGLPTWSSCAGTTTTLQAAYNNGNTITTTNARDLAFTLADTAVDSNFLVSIATGSTSKFAVRNNTTDIFSVDTTTTTIASGGIQVTGNSVITGTLGVTGLLTAQAGLTVSGGNLAVSSGTITSSGNINTTGGGIQTNSVTRIDNSGNLTNIGNENASGTITGGTLTDGTLSIASGAITGGVTGVFSTSLTTPTLYGGTTSGGNITLQSTSNVTKGNVYFNGTTAYVDASSNLFGASLNVGAGTITSGLVNGQTISSSASFTNTVTTGGKLTVSGGGADITGNITLAGNLLPSGSRDVGASGNRFTNGYFGTVDVNTLTVNTSENINGGLVITSATTPQLTVKYDNSNYYTTAVSSAGAVTFDATGAGAAFTFADGLTANIFNSSGVTITGGTIDGTTIGGSTRAAGSFTTLAANNGLTVSAGGASITGNSTITGTLGVTQLLTAQNGLTVSAGNLAVSSGTITSSGTINTTGGAIQTNSVTRIDNSGNLTNIGNENASGTITGGTLTDGTLSINAGAITGGVTGVFSTSLTTPTLYGSSSSGGNITLQSTSNVTKGNVYFNGTTAYVDASSNLFGAGLNVGSGTITSGAINGQTISSSASFTNTVTTGGKLTVSGGGADITGNITLAGNLLPSGSRDIGASGNRFTNGYFGTVDVNTLTVNTTENLNGGLVITSAATPQLTVKYDGSNYYTTAVSSAGAVTFDATGAGAAFTFADGVTANVFNSSGVTITGGNIDGTTIGGSTRAAGSFTTLAANNGLTVSAGGASITGGATIATGNLAVSSGTITSSGNINSTGGAIQTNSTTRIDNSGNLSNIGTIAASGTATLSATGQNALAVTGAPQGSATVSLIQLGSAISGGSSSGTFLGLNAANGYAGDLLRFQVNGSDKIIIDSNGHVGINAAPAGNRDINTGDIQANGSIYSINDVSANGNLITGGTTRITSAGVLQNVTYQGNTIASNYGGTGQSSYTAGDILYYSSGTTLSKLGVGSSGNCLIVSSGVPAWGSCAGTGSGVTLQAAYTNGNTITSSDARNLSFTLADTATDANFLVNIATGSTGKFAVQNNSTDILSVNTTTTTIASGGIQVTGNSVVTGTLGVTALLTAQNGLTVSVGNLAVSSGTITSSGNINTTGGAIQTNSTTRIDNSGNLSNIGTIAASGTETLSATNQNALAVTGTPQGSATVSLFQLGSAISGGSSGANGGTYVGLNAGSSFTGDFLNLQLNNTQKFLITSAGAVTQAGALTVSSGGASITGGLTVATSNLNITGGVLQTAGTTRLDNSGVLQNVTYQGNTIAAAYGGTGQSTYTSGDILYASGSTALSKLGIGSSGNCLIVSSGVPAWGSCSGTGSGVTLQAAYTNGNTISTTSGNDLAVTLNSTSNFTVNIAGGNTGKFAVQNSGTDVLTVTSSAITGAANFTLSSGTFNVSAGAIQTNGTTRVANNGDLTNIGNIGYAGAITQSGTNANTFTGASTFSASGTALTVTNNATIGGTLTVPTVQGSTSSGANLTLSSTSNGTKGKILLGSNSAYDEANVRLGIGTQSPTQTLDVTSGSINFTVVTPPTAPTLSQVVGGGSLSAGTYKYEITYVNSSGETNGGTASAGLAVSANDRITVTIPTSSDPSVTGRKIYRTQVNGSTSFYLVTTINDNTTTSYTDGTSDATIGTHALTQIENTTAGRLFVGGSAGLLLGSGATALGIGALSSYTNAGSTNTVTAIGVNALHNDTVGYNNTALGYAALQSNTSATNNTAVGTSALQNTISGASNTAIGSYAFQGTGSNNTAVGALALFTNGTQAGNTALGTQALESTTTGGDNNVGVGYNALLSNTSGATNVALGYAALQSNTIGTNSVLIGASTDLIVPGTFSAAAASGAGMGSGTYKYKVTFLINGKETATNTSTVSVVTSSGNNQVNLTSIPTYSGSYSAQRKIYRTAVNGSSYKLVTTIADNTTTSYTDTTADGSLGASLGTFTGGIALGASASVELSNTFVLGSSSSNITDAYLGGGVYAASPAAITLHATGGLGSNVAGANLVLAPGQGTGTAAGGDFIVQTAGTGSSGSTFNNLAERLRVSSAGLTSVTGTFSVSSTSTFNGAISVTAGGASITGGLTVTSGGSNITGGETIATGNLAVSSGTITSSGNINTTGGTVQTNSTDRIDNSGNLVNIGTVSTSGAINSQTIGNNSVFVTSVRVPTIYGSNAASGNLTLQSTSDVSKGNVYFNGTTAYVDASSNLFGAGLNVGSGTITSGAINGQTISSSASFTNTLATGGKLTVSGGGADITGNVTVAGNILPSGSRDVGASGNRFTNGYFGTVDVNTLTVNTTENLNGQLTVTSNTTPQFTVKYDGSNYYTTAVSSAGAVTFDATGAGAAFTFADGLTANVFASSGVTITGGNIDGTTIGGTTRAAGSFTTLAANNGLTVSAGGASITGGLTVATGNLAVSSGTITASGNINSTGGSIQTNSTTRIDNSGNLSNIGNISLSGSIGTATTITASGLIQGGSARFDGGIGVGVAATSSKALNVVKNDTGSAVYGLYNTLTSDGSTSATGMYNDLSSAGSGAILYGAYNSISATHAGDSLYGTYSSLSSGTAFATVYGEYVNSSGAQSGSSYAYYANLGATGLTNEYGLYIQGANNGNYLQDKLLIGDVSNTGAKLAITTTSGSQARFYYNSSKYLDVAVDSSGATVFTDQAGFTFTGGGLTISSGGETISSGNLAVSSGTITASGNINTTGGVLQTNSTTRVDNSGNLTNIGNITGTGGVTLQATSGTLALAATGSNIITFSTNSAERARIDANGLFGLNNNAPTSLLDVVGTSGVSSGAVTMTASNGASTFTTSGSVTLNVGDYVIPTTTTGQARAISIGGTGTSFTVGTAFSANVTAETYTVYRPVTNLAVNGGTSALFVQGSTGNVGIGTTNPTAKLHIADGSSYLTFSNAAGLTIHQPGGSNDWTASITVPAPSTLAFGTAQVTTLQASGADLKVQAGTSWTVRLGAQLVQKSSGTDIAVDVVPQVNQTSTAGYTALRISPYEQGTGSGSKFLIDAGTNSAATGSGTHTSKFTLDDSGNVNLVAGLLQTAGTTRLTNAGILQSVTYQGNTIAAAYGGTGVASYTSGDILYASGSTTLSKLGIGSSGNCLIVSSGVPAWGSCAGTGSGTTLQAAYTNGNTISTTSGNDLAVTLNSTSNFTVNIASGNTGKFAVQNNGTDVLNVTSSLVTINPSGGLSVSNGIANNNGGISATGAIAGATTIGANNTLTLSGTGGNELAITGAPAASGSSSLIRIGNATSGGNSSGTYLGINTPSTSADLVNLQNQNVSGYRLNSSLQSAFAVTPVSQARVTSTSTCVTIGGSACGAGIGGPFLTAPGAYAFYAVTDDYGGSNSSGGVGFQAALSTPGTGTAYGVSISSSGSTDGYQYAYYANLAATGLSGEYGLYIQGANNGNYLQDKLYIGSTSNNADALSVTSTSAQARFYYNGTKYADFAVDSNGGLTITDQNGFTLTGGGLTISTGGETISSGNLAVSSGTITSSGNINTTGGALQTNSTTRIDNSGNLSNIGNISLSGSIGTATTITASGLIQGGSARFDGGIGYGVAPSSLRALNTVITDGSASNVYGEYNTLQGQGNAAVYGSYNDISSTSSGTVAYGTYNAISITHTGDTATGTYTSLTTSCGVCGSAYGSYITNTGSQTGNQYAYYANLAATGLTNEYGLYIQGAGTGNYLADKLILGSSTSNNADQLSVTSTSAQARFYYDSGHYLDIATNNSGATTFTNQAGFTFTGGGLTLTSGNLAVSSGNLTVSGTINTATISGGTLSGGSVSGGSLSGGTYTGTGITPTGNYTVGSASYTTTLQGSSLYAIASATSTADYGVFNIGPTASAFNGAAAGHFVGSSNGTQLAVNAASGFTGNLIDLQLAGASKFTVDTSGNLTLTGAIKTTSGNLLLQANSGIVALNTASTQNKLRVYDSSGTKYAELTQDGTNTILSSSSGEVQIAGAGSNQFILGSTGTAVDLIFQESSTIKSSGSKTITVGASGDTFDLSVSGVTYKVGTLSSTGATLATTASGTTPLTINGPSGLTADLLDLQVNSSLKYLVSAAGTVETLGGATLGATSAPKGKLDVYASITGSADYGQVNIGTGATGFDGSTSGHFVGSGNGTALAVNSASSFTGNLADLQVNGTSRFSLSYKGALTVTTATDAVGLTVSQAASATADAIDVNNSSAVAVFKVDVTGHIASGESLGGVPIVGVDPNSGSQAGDLTDTSGPLKPYAGAGFTLNIAAGAAYTANATSGQTAISRCYSGSTTLSMTANQTEYVYVTASGSASTNGITCQFGKGTDLPNFNPSKPVIIIAKVVSGAGAITSVADTRFFIGGTLVYASAGDSASRWPGSIVKIDTGNNNSVVTSTTPADTGVMGIVVVGENSTNDVASGAPNVIMMISGSAWAQAVTGASRGVCAGTSTTASAVNNVTAAVGVCAGRVMTAAASSTPAVLVQVSPY